MISALAQTALDLGHWVELSIAGKATVLLILGLAAEGLTARTRASVRHLLLAATLASLLVLPWIAASDFAFVIDVPVAGDAAASEPAFSFTKAAPVATTTAPAVTESRVTWISWRDTIRWTWLGGALFLLASLAFDLGRLRRIRRDGLPWPELRELAQSSAADCGVRRRVEILLHEDVPAPLTCGVLRPAIVLPLEARGWSEEDLRRVLVHELEHVARLDWTTQIMARVACACYWFHPLAWTVWRRLRLHAEHSCDDAVVRIAEPTDYAAQLVSVAENLSNRHMQAMLGMANRSDLSTRVSALLDKHRQRGRAGLLAAASAFTAAMLAVLAIAPMRAVAQPAGSNTRSRGVSSALDRGLYEASERGDIREMEEFLKAGAAINVKLDGDGSPLIGAARKGHFAAVRFLLDRGADPNVAVAGDGNALIMAAREGHLEIVSLLLDRGARIDEVVPGDENALIQASWQGRLPVVKLLVERDADVNVRVLADRAFGREPELRTPLIMARKGGHQAVVDFLLSAGARE